MNKIENVTIIGMGALGVMYGDFFVKAIGSDNVKYIGDEQRIENLKEKNIYCNKEKCDFTMITPDEAKHADLLIFAVKGNGLDNAIRQAESSVGPETVIMSVLNGISSEEIIGETYGMNHMIYTVAQGMDATKIDNELTYENFGELRIGVTEKENSENLEKVMNFFDEIKMPYVQEEDIKRRIWSKWMLNVGGNQVIMVNEGTYRIIQHPGPVFDMYVGAMREVIKIAEAEGVNITEADLQEYVKISNNLNPDGMPSMRQDGLAKRPSEVEMFAGTVIKKAEKDGIDVPINKELYKKIKEMEARY